MINWKMYRRTFGFVRLHRIDRFYQNKDTQVFLRVHSKYIIYSWLSCYYFGVCRLPFVLSITVFAQLSIDSRSIAWQMKAEWWFPLRMRTKSPTSSVTLANRSSARWSFRMPEWEKLLATSFVSVNNVIVASQCCRTYKITRLKFLQDHADLHLAEEQERDACLNSFDSLFQISNVQKWISRRWYSLPGSVKMALEAATRRTTENARSKCERRALNSAICWSRPSIQSVFLSPAERDCKRAQELLLKCLLIMSSSGFRSLPRRRRSLNDDDDDRRE